MKKQITMSVVILSVTMFAQNTFALVEDFNSTDGGFSVTNTGPVESPWHWEPGSWRTDGTDNASVPTSSELNSPIFAVMQDGPLLMKFDHRYSFENGGFPWDGGQVRLSINGGPYVTIPGPYFIANGYTGIITGNNILNGQEGFSGDSQDYSEGNFITSELSLGTFNAGDQLSLQFVAAWDEFAKGSVPNWEIDGGEVYQIPVPGVILLEIVGPGEVAEDSQEQYKAIAVYDNNSTRDVTDSVDCVWSVEPNDKCSIAVGLLRTKPIDLPMDVTITAEYTEGPNTVEAEKDVSILTICPSGSALEFDGVDDYVNIPDNISLRLPSTLTVETWVKPIYDGRSYWVDAIIVKGQNVGWGPYYNYRVAMENQNLYTWGITRSGAELYFFGGTPIYGNWQHLAVVADGTKCIAYVNGTEVASREAAGPYLTFEGYPLQIGGHAITNARWFSGLIDEVRIWNSARTVDEIRANMHRKPDTGEPNLVGYWNFDEGEGGIAADSSGNGNDGDVVGAVWTDSIPLVGDICSLEGLVERNLSDVLDLKIDALGILGAAIDKEEALLDFMDTSFKNRDFGTAKKGDVVKAKQKIHSAIQHEEQAETAVDQSIDKLDDALNTLGIE